METIQKEKIISLAIAILAVASLAANIAFSAYSQIQTRDILRQEGAQIGHTAIMNEIARQLQTTGKVEIKDGTGRVMVTLEPEKAK